MDRNLNSLSSPSRADKGPVTVVVSRIVAPESANTFLWQVAVRQKNLRTPRAQRRAAPSTGNVVNCTSILTVNSVRRVPTHWAVCVRLGGDDLHHELSLGHFHLANDHPVG